MVGPCHCLRHEPDGPLALPTTAARAGLDPRGARRIWHWRRRGVPAARAAWAGEAGGTMQRRLRVIGPSDAGTCRLRIGEGRAKQRRLRGRARRCGPRGRRRQAKRLHQVLVSNSGGQPAWGRAEHVGVCDSSW
eukprot:3829689-Pyramimonas_sp.AAC.4